MYRQVINCKIGYKIINGCQQYGTTCTSDMKVMDIEQSEEKKRKRHYCKEKQQK